MAPSLGWLIVFAPVEIPGPNVGGLAPLSRPATVWQLPRVIVHVNHRVGGVAEQVQDDPLEALPTPDLRPGSARSRSSRPDLVDAVQVRPQQAMRHPLVEVGPQPIWPLHHTTVFHHRTMRKASQGGQPRYTSAAT